MQKEILTQAAFYLKKERTKINFDNLESLPEPVQRYLKFSLEKDQEVIHYAKLVHGGEFRTGQNQPWFAIEGYYDYLSDEPAFFWKGKIKLLPILVISAKDFYYRGVGEVKIRLNTIIPIGKERGDAINKASLMRFLSEMPLFPTVFLTAPYISWEEIDGNSTRIFIENEGVKAEGIFTFNNKGEIIKFQSVRARTVKKGVSHDKWTGHFSDYKKINNCMIPTRFIAEWNLKEVDFKYVNFKIGKVEYNKI